jgi:hypothetical protein
MTYKIVTPYGSYYRIHANGNIQRLDMEFTPSGDWKFLGLRHNTKPSLFVPFPACFEKPLPTPLSFKNGHPQWTVEDLDHGTRRTWGNTAYHGLREFWKEDSQS